MTDQWHDDEAPIALVRDDDDDAPDDWEAELEEKPKAPVVEEKPKAPSTTKKPVNKKKPIDDEDSAKPVTPQPETSEQADTSVGKTTEHQSLDNMSLLTRKEFLDYSERLSNHLDAISKSEFYPDLVENFLNGITNSMSVEDVKRLATALQVITIRKQGEEREKKSKAKSKKSAKPQLKAVRQSDYGAFGADAANDFDQDVDYDDEDFM